MRVNANTSSVVQSSSSRPNDDWFIEPVDIELGKELGRGAFGVVYKARWHGETVAVKRMAVDGQDDELWREAGSMATLRPHPNVVRLCGVTLVDDRVALVSHYCAKGSLSDSLLGKGAVVKWTRYAQVDCCARRCGWLDASSQTTNPVVV